jgi:hypothetical protein
MTKPGGTDAALGAAERFLVTVMYEDHLTHDRARELCDSVLAQFWGVLDFDFSWWGFDLLQTPALLQAAAEAAARAQLIVVSAHAGQRLPAPAEAWVARWRALRTIKGGILAGLIGTVQERGTVPLTLYLSQVAREARMGFVPRLAPGSAKAQPLDRSASGQIFATLSRMLDPHASPSHWGINE